MRAFLLAAGYGTRLKPITETVPKCLVEIEGIPLLTWWLRLLKEYGIEEVLINTHYLADQVDKFVENFNIENGKFVRTSYEKILLGSSGTVRANKNFVENEEDFLVCYADNLTNINIRRLIDFHNSHSGILTMALHRASVPEDCGIVELGEGGIINKFEEKPINPKSNLANAGVYVVKKDIFRYLPESMPSDFGKDILPLLHKKMYGYETEDYIIDIGSLENYCRAKKEWKKMMGMGESISHDNY